MSKVTKIKDSEKLTPIACELYEQAARLRDLSYEWERGEPEAPKQACLVFWMPEIKFPWTDEERVAIELLMESKDSTIRSYAEELDSEIRSEFENEVEQLSDDAQSFLDEFVETEVEEGDGLKYNWLTAIEWNDEYADSVEHVIELIIIAAEAAEEEGI